MGKWTHLMCEPCWMKKNPDREPVRVIAEKQEPCCFCGELTWSQIFVRHDWRELACKGECEHG